MRGRHRFTLLLAFAATLAAALPATSSAAKRITFRAVDSGNVHRSGSGIVGRLLRTEQSARRQLLDGWAIEEPDLDLTTVDFSRRAVITLLDTVRGSTSWRLTVDSVTLEGRKLTVRATAKSRGLGLTVLIRPWAVVSVPRSAIGRAWPEVRVKVRCNPPSGYHC